MGDIFTNESRAILDGYQRWARQKREKLKTDVAYDARSYNTGRLLESTYTMQEVQSILDGQQAVIADSVDRYFDFQAQSTSELIRRVLAEADRHRIPLNVDAAEALSAGAPVHTLEAVESKVLAGPKGKLQSLTAVETGGAAGRQLADANDEIRRLNEKVRSLTDQLTAVMREKSVLNETILSMQDAVANAQHTAYTAQQVQSNMQSQESRTVQQLRAEVAQLNREMSGKLSQSTQFQSLKRMLTEKNEQVKMLRQHLAMYNPQAAGIGADDDILVEEDDE